MKHGSDRRAGLVVCGARVRQQALACGLSNAQAERAAKDAQAVGHGARLQAQRHADAHEALRDLGDGGRGHAAGLVDLRTRTGFGLDQ